MSIWKTFNTIYGPQGKKRESSYQDRQIFALFCKLDAQILGQNYLKGVIFTKIVK